MLLTPSENRFKQKGNLGLWDDIFNLNCNCYRFYPLKNNAQWGLVPDIQTQNPFEIQTF